MNTQEKIERLKAMFGMYGKKALTDAEATELIAKIDRRNLISTVISYGIGFALYLTAGTAAGALLGLPNPLAGGLAFLIIRLALNYSPPRENLKVQVSLERKAIGDAIANAPTDPAILSELLGSSQFGNPDNTPKA